MTKELFLKIFDAAYMQRWNDKLRPIPFIEIDKQAHKLIIAYLLGKFEEKKNPINWTSIIEGAFFDFLERMIITDIKPPILARIKSDPSRKKELNQWTFKQLEPYISCLGEEFCRKYQNFFEEPDNTIEKRIISAAHIYGSKWEFDILEKANPNGYDIDYIKENFEKNIENYYDLEGIKQLALYKSYRKFIDMCGQLRFQIRWANLHRFPRTSVLGHCFYVAMISYIFSLTINACPKRIYNNFFTALFHDLPEVLTRDIISPVKNSIEGLSDLIKDYEVEQMEKFVYPLLPEDSIKQDIRFYTENEFTTFITLDGTKQKTTSEKINSEYNQDPFSPRDGEVIKAADELAAFIEVYTAILNGSDAGEFRKAYEILRNKYISINNLAGLDIKTIFEYFTL